jgi:tRNA(fMet)-specific endonuclease VapC
VIVADTDVLIDFLAGAEPSASIVARELERGTILTTAITRFELLAGTRDVRHRGAVHDLLAAVPALSLDARAADRAAAVRRDLERIGAPIGMADSLIAGIVLEAGASLLTRNQKHFRRVKSLILA